MPQVKCSLLHWLQPAGQPGPGVLMGLLLFKRPDDALWFGCCVLEEQPTGLFHKGCVEMRSKRDVLCPLHPVTFPLPPSPFARSARV
jgi:hypothetical protein